MCSQIKTKTKLVLTASPVSPLTFVSPAFAITEVSPANTIEIIANI
jgi:hypothetical protein